MSSCLQYIINFDITSSFRNYLRLGVQFPNSVPVIVNLDLTLNFVTLIGRPQCNGCFCWQAILLHLRPSFSSTSMITRTIYVQDLSSGTVLLPGRAIWAMLKYHHLAYLMLILHFQICPYTQNTSVEQQTFCSSILNLTWLSENYFKICATGHLDDSCLAKSNFKIGL